MGNAVSEDVCEKVSFVRVEPSTVVSPDALGSIWQVVGDESGDSYGFVASSSKPRVAPSGKEYKTLPWASAVTVDEFRSGVLFLHGSRPLAVAALFRGR